MLAEVVVDSASCDSESLQRIIRFGHLVAVCAVVNNKWSDFSAMTLLAESRITDFQIDLVRDDTPGSVTLTIRFAAADVRDFEAEMRDTHWIDHFEIKSNDLEPSLN